MREEIGIGLRGCSRMFGLVSIGSAALLAIMLLSPAKAMAGCAGLGSGNYAILLQ